MLRPLLVGAAQGAAAAFFIATTLYCAHATVAKLLPGVDRTVRWSAAAMLGCWTAISSFHLLASFGLFRLAAALGLAALTALLVPRPEKDDTFVGRHLCGDRASG
ncbi:MAG: hypothetical protein ACE5GX_20865 [Thermoanaerobaculia bacterium]